MACKFHSYPQETRLFNDLTAGHSDSFDLGGPARLRLQGSRFAEGDFKAISQRARAACGPLMIGQIDNDSERAAIVGDSNPLCGARIGQDGADPAGPADTGEVDDQSLRLGEAENAHLSEGIITPHDDSGVVPLWDHGNPTE